MSGEWRSIDAAAKSGELIKVRFAPIGTNPNIREYKAHFVKDIGAWSVYPNAGIATNALEWRPLTADE